MAADATLVDAADAAGERLCEKKFFDEREQVAALLRQLVDARFAAPESDVDAAFLKVHAAVTQILDRYLEQSHLLDPYLREMVDPLVDEIKRVMHGRSADVARGLAFPFQVYRNPKLHKIFQLLYHLCKVRGYKTVVKVFPHEVADFEPTLHLLQSQDRTDHSAWETRYVLLLWLSMLCLVPFDLSTIDSSSLSGNGSSSIVASIVTLCKEYLSDPGATQVAAAVCLSRLLSRPDMESHHLTQFLTWANAELVRANEEEMTRLAQFRITGIILCLSHIAKHSPRAQHIDASRIYFAAVMQLVTRLTEDEGSSSTLHRKLSVKLVQRLGLLYLPPRVRAWRYRRGLRSLEMNFQSLGLTSVSSLPATPTESLEEEDDDDVDPEILEELEQIVEVLLCGLRDKDTIVRWSAAKGIGRITGRLPYAFADDIVQSVLELFVATEGDGAWHGASLALAELARRGVLLPQRLSDAVQCVTSALQYDVRRTTHSIGAHVRDAACYACWSFARAYEPSLLLPWLTQSLAPAMLVNCVFDRELNCRRAASAAFQENVGRQGRINFPHGIDLLTRADYFSVSNLRHAYLDVSVFIAQFPEYRYHLLDHLVTRKISHWDANIRSLAASALGRIGSLDPEYSIAHVLPGLLATAISAEVEVIKRHGTVFAITHLLMTLAERPAFLGGELLRVVKMLPIEIEKRRLFRGRGGEMIRTAVCNLVEVISCARLGLSLAHVKKYLAILEECMIHPTESVRESAISSFRAFSAQYLAGILEKTKNPVHVKFVQEIVPRFVRNGVLTPVKDTGATAASVLNPNVAARRGYLRAVGVAAKPLVQPLISECITTLIRAVSLSQQTFDEEDAESRVAAVRALVDLCVRDVGGERTQVNLTPEMEDSVVETLVESVKTDYRIDERGDVGSWIRKEAMLGLEQLFRAENVYIAASCVGLIGQAVDSDYGRGVITGVIAQPEFMRSLSPAADSTSSTDSPEEEGESSGDNYGTVSNPLCIVQFEKPSLGHYYFGTTGTGHIHLHKLHAVVANADEFDIPDSEERARVVEAGRLQQKNKLRGSSAERFGARLSPDLVGSVMAVLSQQLAEKLDSTRAVAGSVFFRLLHSTRPRVDAIPDRAELEARIFPPSLVVNWSMAHDTFPLVVQMMDLSAYLEAVTSGIVLSVGGLTESVVKASKLALFDWIRGHTHAKNFGLLRRFAFSLVALFSRNSGDDRVIIPVMKTLAMLLESNLISFLFEEKQDSQVSNSSEFGRKLYDALRDEIQKCTSVPKLSAGIAVLVGLLPSDNETQARALKALLLFLAHRFPNVRKLTAERLYTRLLVHEEVINEEKYDLVLEKLSDTAWDAPVSQAREARNEILELLDMERPQKKPRADA